MRSIFTLTLLTIAIFGLAVEVGPYKVVKVVDGDTIDVQTDLGVQRIRLLYVDTPEVKTNSHGKEMPEGHTAKAWLTKLLDGKEVKLWGPDKTLKADKDRRILADPLFQKKTEILNVSDKQHKTEKGPNYWKSIAVELVEQGHSVYWRKYGEAPKEKHELLYMSHELAKTKQLGAWKTAPKWMQDKSNERTAPKSTKQILNQFTKAAALELHKKELEKNPKNTHWLNLNSKTRHNKGCSNFGTTSKGRFCTADEGKACGKCGG